jgi:hypothetical protein
MARERLGLDSIMGAAPGALGGLFKLGSGLFGGRKRRREERRAQQEFQQYKSRFMNLDTSNPYANMENVYEDLTVNQQAANFYNQQSQAAMANTMSQFQGAAGGSGIAALAQAITQQQGINLQQAASSIAEQESANEMARANMAGQIQMAERQGEVMSREMEAEKTTTLLGMSQQRVAAAKQARQQATQNVFQGAVGLAETATGLFGG